MNPDLKVRVASLSAHSDRIRAICNWNQENVDYAAAERADTHAYLNDLPCVHVDALDDKVRVANLEDVMQEFDLDAETATAAIAAYW